MRRLTIVAPLAAALLLGAAAPALAVPPSGVTEQVSDQADVMDAGEEVEVQAALDDLSSETGTELYVVYVDSFDGTDRTEWARSSAQQTGLDADDVLMAVAVEDRVYGVHYGDEVDPSDLQDVLAGDVEAQLSQGDWAGASVALAEGLSAGGGESAAAGGSSAGGGGGAVLAVVVLLFLLAGGGYLFSRRRKRAAQRELAAAPAQRREADPHAGTPTEQLNYRGSTALLELDEQVRGAQLNLDYARSYFGDEAVPGLPEALDRSRAELARAFTIRQELDDEIPEDEPTRRRMLTELLALTDAAGKRLEAQAAALEELRERERTAGQAAEELERRIGQLQRRLPDEERRLADLQARYAATVVTPVAENVAEAGLRLAAATREMELAREDQAAGRGGRSVGRLRGAENAVGQSATLLDAIARLGADLAAAEQRVPTARADIQEDLAEARAVMAAGSHSDLRPQIARAESALASADAALAGGDAGRPDPLAALRRLEEADAALEQALQTERDEQTRTRRAAEALDQALLTARAAVAAGGDFISTRRGAVGSTARTRLAEAERHLAAAERQGGSDPAAALRAAQTADRLAQQALAEAEADVQRWSQQNGYGGYGGYGGGYGGGFGGGYGYGAPRRGGIGPLGAGLGGLLLGGLIFGDHDGGDLGGGDWGASDFGGGDFGGDFGGGEF
ncbi:TPM domain-containing protein [Geodermatophilus sabuli]|uniref:TLP18.3, Psb32 and MOLO-1 founding protein of phosphatase n=1 Tax=Geodermatophilus sabuli TaxID=1564158 RepID=A0A285EFA8_9ACTN|nr:TPM domain-containing protein [Geodermatophilus sabuli]MBB3083548.1 putative membrane protein YgcG [Geodermatophilus sabuli]SNX96731.1 TLP18.3, Psb32 and MOLO-1 founding protein of phosphatase [Geodermatophilus sabuli]